MSPLFKTANSMTLFPLGLGTTGAGTVLNNTPEKDRFVIDLFRHAIDLGVNCFDTAEIYGGGYAERLLGKAIAAKRESLFIVTKFNPNNASPKQLRTAIEGSLTRLNTDYVDQYQLHWPNPFVPFERTWGELKRLLEEGKIRSVGVSNCSMQELQNFWHISAGGISAVEVCFNASDNAAENTLVPWCNERNITIFAYSPLGQGSMASTSRDLIHTSVASLCAKYNCSVYGLLLSWVSSVKKCIPVVRTSSIRHLKDNYAAVCISLTEEDRKILTEVFQRKPVIIPIASIVLSPIDHRGIYYSEKEALENRFDWIPSPALLAERIRCGTPPIPIKLRRNKVGSLLLDPYDFQGELKKYWAIRLLYGKSADVTAFVNGEVL